MATTTQLTMLDLVQAVSEYAQTDDEIVATVAYLINSGKVRLCGNFAGAKIDLAVPACATPRVSPRAKTWVRKSPLRSCNKLPLLCILSHQELVQGETTKTALTSLQRK